MSLARTPQVVGTKIICIPKETARLCAASMSQPTAAVVEVADVGRKANG
jgi:hypothetical protein